MTAKRQESSQRSGGRPEQSCSARERVSSTKGQLSTSVHSKRSSRKVLKSLVVNLDKKSPTSGSFAGRDCLFLNRYLKTALCFCTPGKLLWLILGISSP